MLKFSNLYLRLLSYSKPYWRGFVLAFLATIVLLPLLLVLGMKQRLHSVVLRQPASVKARLSNGRKAASQ
jgi:hypothetical protein